MDETRICFKLPRSKPFMKRGGAWDDLLWSDLEKMLQDLDARLKKLEEKDSDNGKTQG